VTRNDYDNIAKCIRRRGTKGQRKALKGAITVNGKKQKRHKLNKGCKALSNKELDRI